MKSSKLIDPLEPMPISEVKHNPWPNGCRSWCGDSCADMPVGSMCHGWCNCVQDNR